MRPQKPENSSPRRYQVRHVTRYSYTQDVTASYGRVASHPRATAHQRVLGDEVAVDPVPAVMTERLDVFGNHTHYIEVRAPHRRLEVSKTAVVEVDRPRHRPRGPGLLDRLRRRPRPRRARARGPRAAPGRPDGPGRTGLRPCPGRGRPAPRRRLGAALAARPAHARRPLVVRRAPRARRTTASPTAATSSPAGAGTTATSPRSRASSRPRGRRRS